ncbi:uncharacterized protein LOC134436072 [Engraulis encrasicolus]|uniref:uncharacterized protein LOC134436072 n=1 Tax=Engraulis encrasicolus TaxID=184585 RepID=UPI002FD0DA37
MKPLSLTLNMLGTVEERHRSIIKFYKTPDLEWASDFICHLEGDKAIGEGVKRHVLTTIMEALQTGFSREEGTSKLLLFEGEEDHRTPTCRFDLIEDGLFIIAGRIMGHSFLHGGPSFTGLSPAIIHVILGGDPKTAPISVADCVDTEVREVLELLEGNAILTEAQRERVNKICLYWDLPAVNRENRKWLYEKIFLHAVLGRTAKQVEQLQKGLTDSGVYYLLSKRPDTAAILFPRTSEREITPQMILDHITWPAEVAHGVSLAW